MDVSSGTLFNLYHLQLSGDYSKNKLIIDFSANVILGKDLKISIIDYENKNEINALILQKNTSNIEIYNEKSNANENVHHIEMKLLNNSIKDLLLCVYKIIPTKDIDKTIRKINYVFKYDTFKPEYEPIKYDFDSNVNVSNKSNSIQLNLNSIKKIEEGKVSYPKGDIYIRKISKSNKIYNEQITTLAVLESKYTLVKGNIKYDNEKIEITLEHKENEEFDLSIICVL